jgi:hypothetical protein
MDHGPAPRRRRLVVPAHVCPTARITGASTGSLTVSFVTFWRLRRDPNARTRHAPHPRQAVPVQMRGGGPPIRRPQAPEPVEAPASPPIRPPPAEAMPASNGFAKGGRVKDGRDDRLEAWMERFAKGGAAGDAKPRSPVYAKAKCGRVISRDAKLTGMAGACFSFASIAINAKPLAIQIHS